MERFFQITAVILAGVAAYFLWQGNGDRAFVAAVCGAVSFFLSVRVEVKKRLKQREIEREEAEREDEIDEEIDWEIEQENSHKLNEMPAKKQLNNEQLTTNDEQKV